jgi:hypothetical protein
MSRQPEDGNDAFDVGRLMPPSSETHDDFERVFAELSPLANSVYKRAVNVTFSDAETGDLVEVHCSLRDTHKVDQTRGPVARWSSLAVTVGTGHDEAYFTVGPDLPSVAAEDAAVMKGVMEEIAADLDEGGDGASSVWLREAYAAAQLDEATMTRSVVELLTTAPMQVSAYTNHSVKLDFKNGSLLAGYWLVTDDEVLEEYPAAQPVRALSLTGVDGISYSYARYEDGRETLFVKKLGERVAQVVDPDISTNLGDANYGLTIGLLGDPEFMDDAVRLAIAEHAEARALKLDDVTEGKLLDFTQALRAGLESGVAQ